MKFHYGDNVKVTGGFYIEKIGRVEDVREITRFFGERRYKYIVVFKGLGMGVVEEKYLKKIPKGELEK